MKNIFKYLSVPFSLWISGCAHYGNGQYTIDLIDDFMITSRVKSALLMEKNINSLDIGVETFDGVVQLTGFVDTQWQIDQAGVITAAVYHVQNVSNNLAFSPGKKNIRQINAKKPELALSVCHRTEGSGHVSDNGRLEYPPGDNCADVSR